jgi:Erg28 like protein
VVSIGNSVQNLVTLHYTRRLYNGRFLPNPNLPLKTHTFNPEDSCQKLISAHNDPKAADQCTPLAARCFGTWTFLTSVVRLYCAYHLQYAPMYDLAYWTYIVAFGHFVSELLVFKSMTLGVPQMFPLTLATVALIWMPIVREHYIGN